MVFSSQAFLFCFLPLVVTLYYAVPAAWRNCVMLAASIVFYCMAGWPLVLLLAGVACLTHGLARSMAKPDAANRKLPLLAVIALNLAVFAFYKYMLPLIDALHVGGTADEFMRRIVLPLGLSFYVLQNIGYAVDVYRGSSSAAASFMDYFTFVAFFPRVVAGPLMRYGDFAKQLEQREPDIHGFVRGFTRVGFGLSKKVLLADPLGNMAAEAFSAGAGSLSAASAWGGILAYAFQLYFDLSGYADMALGLARMFGFELVENFDSPYRSSGFTEFWRRWHMSLTAYTRDYVYVPLGGSKHGKARTLLAVMITVLLAALWHGAGWTLVIWGALHGLLLVIERLAGLRTVPGDGRKPLRTAVTFFILLITWVFFRAGTLDAALRYLSAMFGCVTLQPTAALLEADLMRGHNLLLLLVASIGVWLIPSTQSILRRFVPWKAMLGLALFVVAACYLMLRGSAPFLYSRF